jgi:hypothetical protein
MDENSSEQPPLTSVDPHAELASVLDQSLELQSKLIELHKRIRELNEQIAQRRSYVAHD